MRRRGGWRGNASCVRRKRIVSTRCLNSASRFWSSTWTWAGQLTLQITGQTHTGEASLTKLKVLQCNHIVLKHIFNHIPWQYLFQLHLAVESFWPCYLRREVLGSLSPKYLHTFSAHTVVILSVSTSLIGTVVPVF